VKAEGESDPTLGFTLHFLILSFPLLLRFSLFLRYSLP